jgi:NarL family two-component system response regulator LiaR
MPEHITILVVDDHALVRQGVRDFLEIQPDFQTVGEAGSGEEAVKMVADLHPDIVLMDLSMPGIGGIEATRRIKLISPLSHVIVLTSHHNDEYIFPALRVGALSYILKDIKPGELADVIRKAMKSETVLNSRVASRLVRDWRGEQDTTPNLFAELSERELEVLRHVAVGRSNSEIGQILTISEKTVKVHVSNILGKLQVMDRTQAAALAWQQGLMQRTE